MVYFCFMMHLSRPLNLKKSLGQHFLKDELICQRIIDTLKQKPVRQLLEIGPGAGALTRHIASMDGVNFKAVEIDREKVTYLKKHFPGIHDRIIETDFLKMEKPFEGPFTIIGNFPYNISTEILFKVLDWRNDVERVIGMFQKEVAQRIAASAGNKIYGVTSVLLQAFFEVEYLFEVSEQAFNPPPKVKSAVILLTPRKDPPSLRTEKMFFLLVKTAFNQRRKMLRNAVKGLFSDDVLRDPIFDKRAEQLTILQFTELTWRME
jgi:16S rRNA (adenine1518-N6/adenine1519-N6)-dimethyltransferase